MGRTRSTLIWVSVLGAIGLMWSLYWIVGEFYPQSHPGRMAYVPDETVPPVDLADIQRGWPSNLADDDERARLLAYLSDTKGTVPIPADAAGGGRAAEPLPDLALLLATAEEADGQSVARSCISCHDFSSGGPDRIGPNLWGVVGGDIARNTGFAYSDAMIAAPGVWSYEMLYDFLGSPARAMPGTKMSFAGLRRPEDRAAVIKYLATLGGNPPPFPVPLPPQPEILEEEPE